MKAYLPGMGNTPIAATPRPSFLLQSLIMGSILHLVTPHRQAKPRSVRASHSDPHSCCDGSLLVDYYLTDDDDGSHVDDFNRDDKGVHHNKEDNPFPLKIRRLYTQSQNSLWTANGTDIPSSNWLKDEKRVNFTTLRDLHNPTAELYLPTWTHRTKPTSYQHGHFLNGQQDKRCHTDLLSWRRIHSLSYITPEYGALNYLTTRKTTSSS